MAVLKSESTLKHPARKYAATHNILQACPKVALKESCGRVTKAEDLLTNVSIKRRVKWIRNNFQSISFTCLFWVLNASLFISRLFEYRHTNWLIMGARACGQCLNLDCALLLGLILRRSITRIRNSPLGNIFPCDRHIHLHKSVGWTVFIFSVLHTGFHLANFILLGKETGLSLCTYLWDTSLGIGWIWGLANPTGVFLLLILGLIVAFSHRCVRRSGKFEIFYFTHLLSFPFWILLIIHGPRVWKWLLVPGAAFVGEVLVRVSQVCSSRGRTTISASQSFSSHVTKLVINRPKDFEFRAGEYVYLNIPSVAKYEWHPFTISSSPEEEDIFTVHIRAVGGWTEKVYEMFNRNYPGLLDGRPNGSLQVPNREYKLSLTDILEHVSISDRVLKLEGDLQHKDIWTRGSRYNKNLLEFNRKVSVPCRGSSRQNEDFKYKHGSLDRRKSNSLGSLTQEEKHEIPSPDSGRSSLTGSLSSLYESGTGWTNDQLASTFASKHMYSIQEDQNRSRENSPIKQSDDIKIWVEDTDLSQFNNRAEIPMEIYIDGPYGSPSSNIFNVNHAVLIGAGIGVTPFASILQSVMHRYHEAKMPCPHCKISSCLALPSTLRKLRKVDFIWVNRDLSHFEWFLELLASLEEEQKVVGAAMEKFLTIHLYETGSEHNQFPIPLESAIHQERPDWDQLLSSIRKSKEGRVCVHYCGPPSLAGVLKEKCLQHQLGFRREMF